MLHPRRLLLFVIAIVVMPLSASAWDVPGHWEDVGRVSDWLGKDAKLYRYSGDLPFLDQSQKNVDQQKAYAETRRYIGTMDAIGLADFLALPADEQEARGRATRRHRDFVVRFRLRVDEYVQQSKSEQASGWGRRVADVTILGECLQHLRSATGVDPANPYAWHLYSMFKADGIFLNFHGTAEFVSPCG